MNISDLISLLGIILAIIAFLDSNERLFVINKFSLFDKILIITIFIFINYLLYFEWWYNKFSFLSIFIIKDFPLPETWAYLTSCFLISIIFYKIFYSSFPESNKESVLGLYQSLINEKEFNLVYQYLKKFNYRDLVGKNKNSAFSKLLIGHILSNKNFLIDTASYNYSFIVNIIESNKSNARELLDKFIFSQVNTKDSYLNDNLSESYKFHNFFDLINNSTNINDVVTYNLHYKITEPIKLSRLFSDYYTYNPEFNKINIEVEYLIFKHILERDNFKIINEYFTDYFELVIKFRKMPDLFEKIYLNVICKLNDFSNKRLNDNDIINNFIQMSIEFYNDNILNDIIMNSLTKGIQEHKYNEFRKNIYDSLIKKDLHKDDDFRINVLDKFSNY